VRGTRRLRRWKGRDDEVVAERRRHIAIIRVLVFHEAVLVLVQQGYTRVADTVQTLQDGPGRPPDTTQKIREPRGVYCQDAQSTHRRPRATPVASACPKQHDLRATEQVHQSCAQRQPSRTSTPTSRPTHSCLGFVLRILLPLHSLVPASSAPSLAQPLTDTAPRHHSPLPPVQHLLPRPLLPLLALLSFFRLPHLPRSLHVLGLFPLRILLELLGLFLLGLLVGDPHDALEPFAEILLALADGGVF
jgi:hypothetical protein